MNDFKKPRSLFFPLLLIVVGLLIFLINMGKVEGSTWDNLLTYWPVILILGGLDGLYKRDGWVGPLVLLGFGTILLLGNLGYLGEDGFTLLLRFWPVLLVAIGLDIAFGSRKSVWSSLLRVGLGLTLVAGILWLAVASPLGVGMKSVDFEQSLDGAKESSLAFEIAAGKLNLSGGAETSQLLSGSAGVHAGKRSASGLQQTCEWEEQPGAKGKFHFLPTRQRGNLPLGHHGKFGYPVGPGPGNGSRYG